ncbi:MAG TPA: lysophospholipid acyltransferase family protein [Syntrophales bacterium]|nr:lysophospholipid acyltransferase family protein [Syntrophales bacterium]HQN77471.1 lysophospholipid acyltransferase family protein [Syntrophales bacterium]HQQ27639.1 lysophospholipid acyltransferase family protein [Syntrophales bacterium]
MENRGKRVRRQILAGRFAVLFTAFLTFLFIRVFRYRFVNLREFRREMKRIREEHEGPWLICPNHLTMIDSVVAAFAMAPLREYILHFRQLAWNLPERDNFQKNPALALLCYLCKCLPVHRGGSRDEVRETLDTCTLLLARGESIVIFPEGGRSRTGRVDREKASYGVGRLYAQSDDCRILCLYLRGEGQDTWSAVPKRGERFTVAAAVLTPDRGARGLRAQRACAEAIMDRLIEMEEDWFRGRGK